MSKRLSISSVRNPLCECDHLNWPRLAWGFRRECRPRLGSDLAWRVGRRVVANVGPS